jgi:hypothetical protein
MTDFERQDEINSLMGKLGATSKQKKMLEKKVASLESEVLALRLTSARACNALAGFCDNERWEGTWQKRAHDKLKAVLDS